MAGRCRTRRLAKISWTPDNLPVFATRSLPPWSAQARRNWEEKMRLSETRAGRRVRASACAGTANSAEPVKIRMSWVAPVSNWASIVLEKKDLAKHMGKSYTVEAVRYQGTPQMITAIANNELEVSNLAYSSLALAIENAGLDDIRVIADEFQDGVPATTAQEYLCPQGQRHQQGRGPQGQGRRHQCRRQRGRRRDARDAEESTALRRSATTRWSEAPLPGHAGGVAGEESRPGAGRAAVRRSIRSSSEEGKVLFTSKAKRSA